MLKRSVTIGGHRTSFSLERQFLDELERLTAERGMSLAALVAEIDRTRPDGQNLSSTLRLHVLASLRGQRN
jgi:predicted DNA-binding ribbon-helix-helix protein